MKINFLTKKNLVLFFFSSPELKQFRELDLNYCSFKFLIFWGSQLAEMMISKTRTKIKSFHKIRALF